MIVYLKYTPYQADFDIPAVYIPWLLLFEAVSGRALPTLWQVDPR